NGKAIKADNPVSNRTYWGVEREAQIELINLSSLPEYLYHHYDNKYLMFSTNYFGFLQCQAITLNDDGTYQLHNVFTSTQLYGAPTRPHHLQVLDNNRVIVATADTGQDKGYIGVLNIDESQNITEGVPQVFRNSANTSPGLALVGVDKVLLVFTRFNTTPTEYSVYSKILSIAGTSINMPSSNTVLDSTLVGKTLSGISKISSDTVLVTVHSSINRNLNYYIRRVVGSSNQNLGAGSFLADIESVGGEITAHCMVSPNEGVAAWMDRASDDLFLQKFTIEDDWSVTMGTGLLYTQFSDFDPGKGLALFSLDDGSFLIRAHLHEFRGAVLARISEDLQVINVLEGCNFEQNNIEDIWLAHREGNRLIMYQNFNDSSVFIYVLKPHGRRDFDGIAVTGSEPGSLLDVQFDGILSNIYDNLQAGQLVLLDCDGRASQNGPLGAIVGKAVSAREIDLTQRNQPLHEHRTKRYLDRISDSISTAETILDVK
ncbi:MAG: hypothetical protein MI749_12940, partial [Desulfovibrionales bacterium]|nr:hypothetical protein [Desulfovibrionales bacterium]